MKVEVTKCDLCGAEARPCVRELAIANYITFKGSSMHAVELVVESKLIRLNLFMKDENKLPLDLCNDCWNKHVPMMLTELFKRLSVR